MNARLRSARVLLLLVIVAFAGLGIPLAPPAAAADACTAPHTLAGLIAFDEAEAGPLSVAFRPVYGVYAEEAFACVGDQELTLIGFVASPEGLGGARGWALEPAWLTSRGHFLAVGDTIDPDAGPLGPFFSVAVPPALEPAFTGANRSWVRVTGRFDDPAAQTCTVTPIDPQLGAAPSAEEAIEICRTSFVLTSVVILPGPPPTDTDAVDEDAAAPALGGRQFEVALIAFVVAWFGLVLARRPVGSAAIGSRGPVARRPGAPRRRPHVGPADFPMIGTGRPVGGPNRARAPADSR